MDIDININHGLWNAGHRRDIAVGDALEGIRDRIADFGFKERGVDGSATNFRYLTNDTVADSPSLAGQGCCRVRWSSQYATALETPLMHRQFE
jgi:hypothetical protein